MRSVLSIPAIFLCLTAGATSPAVRWWWHGSAVDSAGITYNLEQFAKAGIKGVEITPIYGVKGNEANDIPYLSEKWIDMLGHTVSEGRRLGVRIDMNNGTGWPFGGPHITPQESARKLVTRSWTLHAGERLAVKLFPVEKQPDATLQRVMAVTASHTDDITGFVKGDSIYYTAPDDEDCRVYAIYSGRTYQKVKRAAPGGEGLVVNHYDSIAVKHYLHRFDEAFAGKEEYFPSTLFNDSYEVYGADWSDTLLDEFIREHGYDLAFQIADFIGDNGETSSRRKLLHDYRLTLARLLKENFTRIWTGWAHSHGALVRNQSHGSPANILDIYADVDIPECESFGRTDFDIPGLHPEGPSRPSDSSPAVLKFASSAAHVAGKKFTSAEALTWLTEHFHTSLRQCKPELDQLFCSGVNHVVIHGAAYSPEDAPWPGRLFYAAINMSPTSSLWAGAPQLFRYISRIQEFLSEGWPDNDLLLYFPYEDIITRTGGKPYLMFDIHKMDRLMPDVRHRMESLMAAGYDVDYVSDRLLDSLTVDRSDGYIVSRGGNRYRALVVPDGVFIPETTLVKLSRLSEDGARVVNTMPEGGEPLRRKGVSMIRRVNDDGGHNYFMTIPGDTPIDGWYELAVKAGSIMLTNPLTGESGLAGTRTGSNGMTGVRLQLDPGESLLMKTYPDKRDGQRWKYISHTSAPIAIERGWSIDFPVSDPPIDGVFHTDTLTAWTCLHDPRARTNRATGRYQVKLNIDDPTGADDWMLDLGDLRESARVEVNGIEAGHVWSVPGRIKIGRFLKKGENHLRIDVTNLDANRIADYERRGVEWRIFKEANIASVTGAKKFSFSDCPTIPAGLNSTVKLFPIYYEY